MTLSGHKPVIETHENRFSCLFFILTFDIDSPEARNYRKNLEVEVTATRGVISPSPDTIYG